MNEDDFWALVELAEVGDGSDFLECTRCRTPVLLQEIEDPLGEGVIGADNAYIEFNCQIPGCGGAAHIDLVKYSSL